MNWKHETVIWVTVGLITLISPMAALMWVLAAAVFVANPLNDPMRPDSLMNPLHPENVELREDILRDESCVGHPGHTDVVLIEWPDVAPYLVGFIFAGAALIGQLALRLAY